MPWKLVILEYEPTDSVHARLERDNDFLELVAVVQLRSRELELHGCHFHGNGPNALAPANSSVLRVGPWSNWMPTKSELLARLERLGPVRAVNRPRLSLEDAETVLLVRNGPLDKAVTIAIRLADTGAGLKGGHDAINALASTGRATCVVSRHTDFAALARELDAMNVVLHRRRSVDDPAAFIAAVRERHKLSQREFAERLGLDVRTLQNWEQGRNRPDGPVLAFIRFFDEDPDSAQKAVFEPVAEPA